MKGESIGMGEIPLNFLIPYISL